MSERSEKRALERRVFQMGKRIDDMLSDEPDSRHRIKELVLDQSELLKWEGRPLNELVEIDPSSECFVEVYAEKVDGKIVDRIIRIKRFDRDTKEQLLKNVGDECVSWDYMLQLSPPFGKRTPRVYSHADLHRKSVDGRTQSLIESDNRVPPQMHDFDFFDHVLATAKVPVRAK